MKRDFHVANIDRFRSGGANNTSVKENKADVAENAPPRPGEVLPEQKAESVKRPIEDKSVAPKHSADVKPRVGITHERPYYDITIMTDRHSYDELAIRLKERGKNNRSGFRDAIAELIDKQSKEDIEQAAMSVRVEGVPYKTSVRIPFELYLNVYRYSRRNHVSMLQIVNAAIAKIMS